MKKYIITISLFLVLINSYSQESISKREGYKIIESQSNIFPKFYRAFKEIEESEKLFSKYKFVRGNGTGTAGKANSKDGIITFDISYIEKERKNHDDAKLATVLYHELGHIYYRSRFPNKRNDDVQNEKYAFAYSLKRAKSIADEGDCSILKSAIESMQKRSKSIHLDDPHTIALQQLVNERMFYNYLEFFKKCSE
jgi:hypothetical protein